MAKGRPKPRRTAEDRKWDEIRREETKKAVKSINKNIFENIAYQQGLRCMCLGTEMIQIPSTCMWKSSGNTYSQIRDEYESGLPMYDTYVQATRVFEKMGYSIETYMDVKNKYGKLMPQNGLICISDSTQRDNENGTMIHNENTKSTYIVLNDYGGWVIQPESAELKQKSFDEFRGDIDNLKFKGKWITLSRADIENTDEDSVIMLDGKIDETLKGIALEFAELWESITSEYNEKIVEWVKKEAEKDSYKELSDVMDKQVTTEGTNKGKSFLGRLFGRNKEQQAEAPEK